LLNSLEFLISKAPSKSIAITPLSRAKLLLISQLSITSLAFDSYTLAIPPKGLELLINKEFLIKR